MSVDQTDVVDAVGMDPETGRVTLLLSDHLDWEDAEAHTRLLQEKLATYVAFVVSGQLVESFPEAHGRRVHVQLYHLFAHSPEGAGVIATAQAVLAKHGLTLSLHTLPPEA